MKYECSTCDHPLEDHATGICLHTLECLCTGYADIEDFFDSMPHENLPEEQIAAIMARIRAAGSGGGQ